MSQPTLLVASAAGLLGGVVVGVLIATVIVLAAVPAGLVLLFRNRAGAQPSGASGLDQLRVRADVALVRLDETLASADNELGFAIAQFGEERTAEYAEAVRTARGLSTSAFRISRELDDAFPETVTRRRELTLQMLADAERAQRILDEQEGGFARRRTEEVQAPRSIATLRDGLAAASARVAPARETLERLAAEYRPGIVAEQERGLADCETRLATAGDVLASAEGSLSPAGVNAVVGDIGTATQSLAQAVAVLDRIDELAARLDGAAEAVATLVAGTRDDLGEARRERESAPDPDTRAAIVDAIDAVERTVAAVAGAGRPADPIEQLDRLNAANAQLDTALASARTQAERLEHARLALTGTLASARSQVTAARGLIAAGRGGVGANARSRLSEAERELADAEAETDPIAALDAARRAVTHARDADALARYDARR